MILPLFRRITEEDLADAPKGAWKGRLLYAINLFFQQIYTGLSNQLTPEQNSIEQTKSFLITGSSTPAKNIYTFVADYTYNPSFIEQWIIAANGNSAVFTAAPYVSAVYNNGAINILGISGLTDGTVYQITLRIWWPAVINS